MTKDRVPQMRSKYWQPRYSTIADNAAENIVLSVQVVVTNVHMCTIPYPTVRSKAFEPATVLKAPMNEVLGSTFFPIQYRIITQTALRLSSSAKAAEVITCLMLTDQSRVSVISSAAGVGQKGTQKSFRTKTHYS